MQFKNFLKISIHQIFVYLFIAIFITSCGFYEKVDQRTRPDTAKAKARKNVEEGKGVSVGGLLGARRGGTFEFSSSNPLWKATLETLDFLPMSTVDYSGGIIITDWYTNDRNSNRSLKITVRFLSNEVRSDSLKIVIHEKICVEMNNCLSKLLTKSQIRDELNTVILRKAALLEKAAKNNN